MIRLGDLMGQQTARELVERMLTSGRVPNGLLFQGPEGVGKGSLARAAAAALLCDDPRPEACGSCESCALLERGSHPDFLVVERQPRKDGGGAELRAFIVVDQIRQVSQLASMAPRRGRRRVFIVDPADRMNREAQNALLKTLEEPPGATLLILVTSRPQMLLPTVRSRCFAIPLGPLRTGELAELLVVRGVPEAEAMARAALSEGRPGRALDLDLDRLRERREELLGIVEALARPTPPLPKLPAMAGWLAGKTAGDLQESLDLLAALLRDAGLAVSGLDADAMAHADLASRLERLGATLGPSRIAELVTSLDRQRNDLRLNLNRVLVAESLLAAVAGGPLP